MGKTSIRERKLNLPSGTCVLDRGVLMFKFVCLAVNEMKRTLVTSLIPRLSKIFSQNLRPALTYYFSTTKKHRVLDIYQILSSLRQNRCLSIPYRVGPDC